MFLFFLKKVAQRALYIYIKEGQHVVDMEVPQKEKTKKTEHSTETKKLGDKLKEHHQVQIARLLILARPLIFTALPRPEY